MREIISLNENWTLSFPKGERPTEQVTLPHTWNAVDGMDGNGRLIAHTAASAAVGRLLSPAPAGLWRAAAPTLRYWQLLWPQP